MDKRFLAILAVIVVAFAGVIVINNHKKNATQNSSTTSASSAGATNHIEGNAASKVTLVEYGDYECPVCEAYYPAVQQVQQKYNATVKFQFRNLPLSSIHPNALAGARAAEAADMQGKFWGMHDALYNSSNWQQWSTSSDPQPYFTQYATSLGLNVTKFNSDYKSIAVNDRIQADLGEFGKTGQQEATPTFFLNGQYISNASLVDNNGPSAAAFGKVLDAALKSAK